jgi:transposase-like protein
VQIDESMFHTYKKYQSELKKFQWYVGGICEETDEIFIAECPNNKRDQATLKDIIMEHVHSDSIIITDSWKGYNWMDRKDNEWTHFSVNHKYFFKDPITGIEKTFRNNYKKYQICNILVSDIL